MAEAASSIPSCIFVGRKQESAVWKYFAYNEEIKKNICQVITSDNKICSYPVTLKNTTNLKTHLHRHHADKYEVFLKNDNHNKFKKKKASGR